MFLKIVNLDGLSWVQGFEIPDLDRPLLRDWYRTVFAYS